MTESHKSINTVVRDHFGRPTIVVIGDLMLDRYLSGDVTRISAEAPVPIVHVTHEENVTGGAANVAANLAGLGVAVKILGVVGDDEDGKLLLESCANAVIDTSSVVTAANRSTTVKTRVIGASQQMLRLDREDTDSLTAEDEASLRDMADTAITAGVSAIVISDYAKGVVTDRSAREFIRMGRDLGIPVFVDPKGIDYSRYAGATAVSPNKGELEAVVHRKLETLGDISEASTSLREELGLDFVLVTLGADGMLLESDAGANHVDAVTREVFDVSGAGDTVVATLSAAMVAGLDVLQAVELASTAAGVVVEHLGTVPVTNEELLTALDDSSEYHGARKLYSAEEAATRVTNWRTTGNKIVFTNGCFDLLHPGHVSLLERARREGDKLVVGLNADDSVRRLKGDGRPVLSQLDRARLLSALSSVDAIVVFEEDTPINLIRGLQPDILVKGDEYEESEIVGSSDVATWGGKTVTLALVEGSSTTGIIERIADQQ